MPDENENAMENETEGVSEAHEAPAQEGAVDTDAAAEEAEPEEATAEVAAEEAAGSEAESEPPAAETETAVEAEAETGVEAVAEETAVAPSEAPAAEAAPAKRKKKRLPRSQRPQRPKKKREQAAERKPITRLPEPERQRGRRQERQGTVVSAAADKTIVVRVDVVKVHPTYKKVIKRSTKLHAHDERNEAKPGDVVRIVETRPLSRMKRWRLQEIVEAAK